MKTHIFLFFFCLFPSLLHSQIWDWGRQLSTSAEIGWPFGDHVFSAVDPLGNILSMGNAVDTIYFGTSKLPPDQGFLAKYSPDGNLLWIRSLTDSPCGRKTKVAAVKTDENGNIFAAYNCDALPSEFDFTIKKFDAQGRELFVIESYGSGSGIVNDIELGPNGEIFAVGTLYDNENDTLNVGGVGIIGTNNLRPFMFKIDAMGNGIWARTDETDSLRGQALGNRIAVDKQGNSYLMGVTKTDIEFGNGVSFDTNLNPPGQVFVVKFDPNGATLWGNVSNELSGQTASEEAREIVVDNEGHVFLAGNFADYFGWDTFYYRLPNLFYGNFLLCLSDQGQSLWVKHIEINGRFGPNNGGMAIDTVLDELYLMGVAGTATLDSLYFEYPNCRGLPNSQARTHVAAFDKNGNPKWLVGIPCMSPAGKKGGGTEIVLDHKGGIYVSGVHEHGILGLDTLFSPIRYTPFLAKLLINEVSIRGKAFRDFNGNGIQDGLDEGIPEVLLESSPLNLLSITDSSGEFDFGVDLNTHTVSLPTVPQHHTLVGQNSYTVVPMSLGETIDGHTFALKPTANIQDLEITISPLTRLRPGFQARYEIVCKNVGSVMQTSNLSFVHPEVLTYLNSSLSFTSYDPATSTMNWDLGNIEPFQSKKIQVTFQVTDTARLGRTFTHYVQIFPISGDVEPQDNTFSLAQTVRGSYDPNDKQTLSGKSITPQMIRDRDPIDYLIRFQNTGTDTAFTVVVEDIISPKLDVETFQMIDASHDYQLSINEDGLFSWRFDNILLPDSNINEALSHGYIRFNMAAHSNLVLGDTILNQAAIYFDYNAPVITNTVKTPIAFPISIKPKVNKDLRLNIYPNPGEGQQTLLLEVPKPGIWNLNIFDIFGRKILGEDFILRAGKNTLYRNWEGLPSTCYMLILKNEERQVMQKWIKS